MTRTIPSAIAADLAAGTSTLSRCLRLDLRDGSSLGFTDHDGDMEIDLGDGSLVYSSSTGALPSSVSLSIGLEADNFELTGPLGDLVTREAVLGGRFDRARARLFDADWSSSPSDFVPLMAGKVAESRVEAGAFVLAVRSAADAFNQSIGRVLTPYCSHSFGEGQCQALPQTWTGAVSAATTDFAFSVSWDSPMPVEANILNGLVSFDTGDLAGTLPVEVFDLTAGVLGVYAPLAGIPAVSDTFTVTEGCDKLRTTCKVKGQILNFGGFPDLTGTDDYLKYPNPGG